MMRKLLERQQAAKRAKQPQTLEEQKDEALAAHKEKYGECYCHTMRMPPCSYCEKMPEILA